MVMIPTINEFTNDKLLIRLINKYITVPALKDNKISKLQVMCMVNDNISDAVTKYAEENGIVIKTINANRNKEIIELSTHERLLNFIDYYIIINESGEYNGIVNLLTNTGINHMTYDFVTN